MNLTNMMVGGGAAVAALLFLVLAIRSRRKADAARAAIPQAPATPDAVIGGEAKGFKRLGNVLKPSDKASIEQLKNRVSQAGLYSRDAVDMFLAVRLTLLVMALVVSLFAAANIDEPLPVLMIFMISTCLAVLGPGLWLDARMKARHAAILASLPSTVDLLVTCLEAGLNLEQAVERVSEQSAFADDLLAQELSITLSEMKAGLSTDVAFRKFAARIGLEDINTLTAVITQASSLGTNIAGLLRDHAKTMRQHRMLRLEESAGKANAQLTLPLTMCLLPAVMTLLLGPAVLMFFRSV